MDFFTYSDKLDYLLKIIESNSGDTAISLALRLGVSRRTVIRMIEHQRNKGIKIVFCKKNIKYFIEK